MDNRPIPHPPTVIAAMAACLVSLIKTFGPKDVPTYHPPVVEVIEIDEGFLVEDDAVKQNGTASTLNSTPNPYSAKTLLIAMSALLLFSAFGVTKIWHKLSVRTPLPHFHTLMLAFLLLILTSSAAWATTAWNTTNDRCSDRAITTYLLLAAFLSPTWNIVKARVRFARRRFYNIMVWAVLVILLCLALWKMKIAKAQEYCQYKYDDKVYLLPFLLIMAFRAFKKLAPCLRRRRLVGFVFIIVTLPVHLITLPVHHLRYLLRSIEPAKKTRPLPPVSAPAEDEADPRYQSEIRRLRSVIKFLLAVFRLSKLKSSAEVARLREAIVRASEHTITETTRLARRYDDLEESTREALDPTGLYGHGQSLMYIIHRVKDRIARQMAELKRKEEALQDLSAMKAAVEARHVAEEARKSAEASAASFEDQLTRVNSELQQSVAKSQILNTAVVEMMTAQQSHAGDMAEMKTQLVDANSRLQNAGTKCQEMETAQESHAEVVGDLKQQLADTNSKLQDAVTKCQEMETTMYEKSSQVESTTSELATFKEQFESLKRSEELSKSEREAAEAKARSLKQEVEGLHVLLSDATLAATAKDDQIRTLKEQVAASAAQDASQPPRPADDMRNDSNAEGNSRAAEQITALNGALEAERAQAQNLAAQVEYFQRQQQQQQEYFKGSEATVQGLSQELGVANSKVAELTQKLNSGSLQYDEMGATLRSAEQKLGNLERYRSDADSELKRQQDQIEISQGETQRARELCHQQREELNVLKSNVKALEQQLEKSDDGTHSTPSTSEPLNHTQHDQVKVSGPTQYPPVTSSFTFGTAVEASEPFVFGSTAQPMPDKSSEVQNGQGNNSIFPIQSSYTPVAGLWPSRSPESNYTKIDPALGALQDDASSSTKPASESQPGTNTMPSGFRLDPNHDFGFSFERPAAVTQEPLPEQRIFNLPAADPQTPSQPPQQFDSEDAAEVAEEQRTQEILRRIAEIDAEDEDAETTAPPGPTRVSDEDTVANSQPCPTTFPDDDEFYANLQGQLENYNDPALDASFSNVNFDDVDFDDFDFNNHPDDRSTYGNDVPDDWNPTDGHGDNDILWDHDTPGWTASEPEPEADWPQTILTAEEEAEINARIGAMAEYDPIDWNPANQQPQGPFDSAPAGPSSLPSYPPQSRKRSRFED